MGTAAVQALEHTKKADFEPMVWWCKPAHRDECAKSVLKRRKARLRSRKFSRIPPENPGNSASLTPPWNGAVSGRKGMVGPGGVVLTNEINGLGRPTPSNRGIDFKRVFSPLSNLKRAQKKARRVVTGGPMTIPPANEGTLNGCFK